MNEKQGRLFGAVALAVILVGLFIASIELEGGFFKNAFQLGLGFFVVAIAGFVIVNLHSTILYFISTVVFLLAGYLVYKQGWTGTAYGAGAGVLLNTVLHFCWVRPNTKTPFNAETYAREQQKIREAEKAGGPSGPGALPGK